MKKMVVAVVALALLAVLTAARSQEATKSAAKVSGAASAGGTEAEVLQLEDRVRQASLKADAPTLQEMLADDYVSISAVTGSQATKADALNNYKSGRLKYDSLAASEIQVHVYGPSTALLTARVDAKGKLGDRDLSGSYRYSRLYVKRAGKWQVVAFQSTKIPG